jgi:signal transduction histidine kinase
MNIRTRLTVQFILLTAGIFLTALFFIYNSFKIYVENEFYQNLAAKGRATAEMILQNENQLERRQISTNFQEKLPENGNIVIFDNQFRCVYAQNMVVTKPIDATQLMEIAEKGSCRMNLGNRQTFGDVVMGESGQPFVVISENYLDYSKLENLRRILILSFLLVVLAIAAGGWYYSGEALRPVTKIVAEVEAILPTDLSRRLPSENTHDELAHLVGTFNLMLERIEKAFKMQRGFISNVAHELKNPIAAIDAQLQLALSRNRSEAEYYLAFMSIHEDIRALSFTTDKLLQLAKVHSDADAIAFSEVRLDELLYQTRENLLKIHPNFAVQIEILNLPENPDQLCILGNEPLLRTALLNLFQNGCKFSPDHKVEITIAFLENDRPEITIRNEGVPIAAEDLPRIFEPFYRGSLQSKMKGSGVGLSLVQSILALHGIGIRVESSEKLGTCFMLTAQINY